MPSSRQSSGSGKSFATKKPSEWSGAFYSARTGRRESQEVPARGRRTRGVIVGEVRNLRPSRLTGTAANSGRAQGGGPRPRFASASADRPEPAAREPKEPCDQPKLTHPPPTLANHLRCPACVTPL